MLMREKILFRGRYASRIDICIVASPKSVDSSKLPVCESARRPCTALGKPYPRPWRLKTNRDASIHRGTFLPRGVAEDRQDYRRLRVWKAVQSMALAYVRAKVK